jgi:hypothetical protein
VPRPSKAARRKPTLDFWWAWGSQPLWPGDDAAPELLGSDPVDLARLGVPRPLAEKIRSRVEWHDTALNTASPTDPGPWRQEECDRINMESRLVFEECAAALGDRFDFRYMHVDEVEDP